MASTGLAGLLKGENDDWDLPMESCLEELSPINTVKMFTSVLAEFGEYDLLYMFNEAKKELYLSLQKGDQLVLRIVASSISESSQWSSMEGTDFMLLRTFIPNECNSFTLESVMELNFAHPNIKFYLKDGFLIIEDSYYLPYGVPILNLLDRFCSFITTASIFMEPILEVEKSKKIDSLKENSCNAK